MTMGSLWKILTLPCEEAARLMSDERDNPLTGLDRVALKAHLFSCRSCKRFRKQLQVIHDAAGAEKETLSPEAKERIEERLDQG